MKINIALFVSVLLSIVNVKAQTLNPTYKLTTAGEADNFFGGYTFSYRAAGTPWNGALISYGGFDNTYDTQLSSSYEHNRISFRTRNGDDKVWNAWCELATKGSNDFLGNQSVEGNLGIGTTNPLAKLEVRNGNIIVRNFENRVNQSAIMIAHSISIGDYDTFGTSVRTFTESADHNIYAMQFYTQESHETGQTEKLRIQGNGNVGIGTTNPDSKLTVAGNIHAQEVKVTINAGSVPDYVFANDYKLKSLQEVEDYIKQNSHLPEIQSATEIEKNGLMLAEMNLNLLKKVEELTLYIIEQNKRIEKLEKVKR